MALISAWRRKPGVHLIAILDCIFIVLTLALHSYNFIDEDQRKLELSRGFLDVDQQWDFYILLWVTVFIFNILHFLIAHLLHMSVRPDYADAQLVQGRANRWLRFSSIVFILLLIKFILFMIYLAKFSHVDILTLFTCLAEILFRMITVYMVKRFVDDLRSQYPLVQRPSVYFINMFAAPNITRA